MFCIPEHFAKNGEITAEELGRGFGENPRFKFTICMEMDPGIPEKRRAKFLKSFKKVMRRSVRRDDPRFVDKNQIFSCENLENQIRGSERDIGEKTGRIQGNSARSHL